MSANTETDIVMQTLLEQNKTLGYITGKVDAIDEKLDTHVAVAEKVHKRVGDLENAHSKMKGAAAVWSLVISAVVSAIGWYFGNGSK